MRNRAFVLLFLSLFGSSLGIGMVSPILPVVAKDMGATGVWVGLSFSAFALTQVASTFVFGRWSDRIGRRHFLIAGFFLYGIAGVGYLLSSTFYELIFWRAFAGFGTAAAFPIALAYVGDISPPGSSGSFMGTFNVGQWVGFGLGPALGGVVRDAAGADGAFFTMTALLFGMAVLLFLLLPESPRFIRRHAGADPAVAWDREPSTPIRTMLRDNVIRGAVTFYYIATMGFGTVMAFLAIFMEDTLDSSATMIGLVLAARTLTNGSLAPYFGRVADRRDRTTMITGGLLVAAALSFFTGDMRSEWALILLFMAIGACEGIAYPAVMSYCVDAGRPFGMGSVMGLTQAGFGVGILIGSLIGGVLESSAGIEWVFRFAAMVTFAAAVLTLIFLRRGSPVVVRTGPVVALAAPAAGAVFAPGEPR